MTQLLAIDAATDALSLALQDGPLCRSLHRVMPRQHQQQIFLMLEELLQGRSFAELNLEAIVYGRGPGSFTGLRIAVSAAQGLAYSLGLPVVGVSSLETQAWTLIRREELTEPCTILSTIDARIGQVYLQSFEFDGTALLALNETLVAAPEGLDLSSLGLTAGQQVVAVGSGCGMLGTLFTTALGLLAEYPDLLPEAQDMLHLADDVLRAGQAHDPAAAVPDYVQKRIGWKTLAEQGKKA